MVHIFGRGDSSDRNSLDLQTRKKRRIPNEQQKSRSSESMSEARKIHLKAYTTWECRSLESIYNCMGLVFASRRTAIEPEFFDMIVSDDGYTKLLALEDALFGDVFAYRDQENLIAHVGILVEKLRIGESVIMKVLSQWGQDGEYVHNHDQWPKGIDIHGGIKSIEAWTHRKA